MSDEMKPEVLPGDLISGPGVYISRSNCAVEVRGYDHGYWRAEWEDGARWYHSSGTQTGLPARDDPYQLVRWVGPLAKDTPTTSEQIAEIEEQGHTMLPEGWQVVPLNEPLRGGDEYDSGRNRYIRRIEQPQPEPQPEPEPEPQPVQVREGRWRTRGGDIRNVTPTPTHDSRRKRWPWRDAAYDQTWTPDGQNQFNCEESPSDLVEYLGSIEPKAEPVPAVQGGLVRDVTHLLEESGVLDSAKAEQQIEELRSEVSYVQRLLGTERRRVTQLEELVGSLRNINDAQEKAFGAAGKENTALQTQLEAVKAESAKRLETIQELRDEVSQVHRQWGDSRWRVEELEQKLAESQPQPVHQQAMMDAQAETIARLNSEIHELNIDIVSLDSQLEAVKAELVQVSKDRQALQIELDAYELRSHNVSDRFEEGWDKGTAQAVETIAEWLEPLRKGNCTLRAAVLFHLPAIMRSLTGLTEKD